MQESLHKSLNDNIIDKTFPALKSSKVYDPYQMPPNLDIARNHLKATSLGEMKSSATPKLCECCQNPTEIEPFDMLTDVKKFARYGISYTLLFYYILFMAGICLLIFSISGVPFIFLVPNALDCILTECQELQFLSHYKNSNFLLHILGLVCLLIFIGLKILFSQILGTWEANLDRSLLKPNDYTLYVQGLPADSTEAAISDQLAKIFAGEDFKIEAINKIYDITLFSKMVEERIKVEQEFFKISKLSPEKIDLLKLLEREYSTLTDRINSVVGNLEGQSNFAFSGSAFVILRFEEEMHRLLRASKRQKLKLGFFRNLKIQRAALPTNVIWDNYCLSKNEKIIRRSLSILIAAFLIFLTFMLLLAIERWEEALEKKYEAYFAYLTFVFNTLIVYFVNQLLWLALDFAIDFERRPTFSDLEISKIRIQSTAQFINTAIIILIANLIEHKYIKIIGRSEVLRTIALIMIVEYLSEIFYFFADLHFLPKYFKRRKLVSQMAKDPESVKIFQFEANKIFENPPFELFEPFTTLFSSVAVAMFYFPIFPFGLAIAAVHLFTLYFLAKYRLIYRSRVIIEYEFEFSKKILKFTEVVIFYFGAGYLFFDLVFLKTVTAMTWVIIAISFLQLFFFKIRALVWPAALKPKYSRVPYARAKSSFLSDYEKENPVTKLSAYKKIIHSSNLRASKGRDFEFASVFRNVLKSRAILEKAADVPLMDQFFLPTREIRIRANSQIGGSLGFRPENEEDISLYQNPYFSRRVYYNKMADLIFKPDQNPIEYELLEQEDKIDDQPLLRGNTFKL